MSERKIFFVAVNTGFATMQNPDDRCISFYMDRSSSELYCAIVGNVVIPGGVGSNSVSARLSTHTSWKRLAHTIRSAGSRPGIQLATAWEGYEGVKKFVSSRPEEIIAQARQMIASMRGDEVDSVLNSFADGADIAVSHGFEHIQFHAAHGYMLNLLVDSRINPNAEYVLDRLSSISERLRAEGVETSLRISLRSGCESFDRVGSAKFQDCMARLPFDFIDMSSGFYNIDKRLIYPSYGPFLEDRYNDSVAVAARNPDKLFILSGRSNIYKWDELPRNIHIGVCRDILANPGFLRDRKNGCKNKNKCHYYSRGEVSIWCGIWTNTYELRD